MFFNDLKGISRVLTVKKVNGNHFEVMRIKMSYSKDTQISSLLFSNSGHTNLLDFSMTAASFIKWSQNKLTYMQDESTSQKNYRP